MAQPTEREATRTPFYHRHELGQRAHQPHHAGGAFIFGPDGEILAESQAAEIRDEMVVATLDAELLNSARRSPNYTLRTRRPELFSELVAEQVES